MRYDIPERHKDSRFWHVSTSLQRNVGRANMVYNIHALHQKPGLLLYVHVLREEEREPKCKVVGKGTLSSTALRLRMDFS